jgi:protein SCO1
VLHAEDNPIADNTPSLCDARRRSPRLMRGFLAAVIGLAAIAPHALAQARNNAFDPAQSSAGTMNLTAPEELKGLDIIEKLGDRIPLDLVFDNTAGKPVKLGDYFFKDHRPVVLALVYFRCPMQCPLILSKLGKRFNELDKTIGEHFNVVVVSFDPTEGADAASRQQLTSFNAYNRDPLPENLSDSWAFLTGPAETSRKLAQAVGFPYRYLAYSGEYSHPAVIFVLTPDGTVSRYLYGVDFPTDRLRMALLEASDGRIGSSWDRIILWCFHFDPTKGEYVLKAFRVMQVATVVMAVAVGSLLAAMWFWVERRRRPWTSFRGPASVAVGGVVGSGGMGLAGVGGVAGAGLSGDAEKPARIAGMKDDA